MSYLYKYENDADDKEVVIRLTLWISAILFITNEYKKKKTTDIEDSYKNDYKATIGSHFVFQFIIK